MNNNLPCYVPLWADALVIVLSAITSHLRLAQFVVSKLQALEMIRSISHHIPDEAILERVIPYLVSAIIIVVCELKLILRDVLCAEVVILLLC